MPFDPNQRQAAMAGMAKAPISSAPQGIFSAEEDRTKDVDSEASLQKEMEMLEKAKLDGQMNEADYLQSMKALHERYMKMSASKQMEPAAPGSAGPFGN
jgi:hypothetical protein